MFRELIPAVLTHDECLQAIRRAEERGFEPMGSRYPQGYRNNDRLVVDDAAMAAELFRQLRSHLPAVWNEDGSRWSLAGLNPRFRFCRYRDGQEFTRHRDGSWSPSPEERSWLTVMLYLNDAREFVGGATRFYAGDEVDSVPPAEGQAIVFDHRLWHDGEAVTVGVKYVMRSDVMYRLEQEGVSIARPSRGQLELERLLVGHTGYVWVVRRLSDGRLVSGSRDCTVRRWGEGEVLREGLAGSAIAILEVGEAMWVGSRHGILDDGQHTWQAHDGAVLGLERMADGSVVSCGADGAVRRWSPRGEALSEVSRHDGWVWGISIDAGRMTLAVEPTTAVAVGATGNRSGMISADGRTWRAHDGAVTALVAFNGGWVSGGEDCCVKMWSRQGELLGVGAHRDFVRSVALVDSRRFATASYDGTLVIWRLAAA